LRPAIWAPPFWAPAFWALALWALAAKACAFRWKAPRFFRYTNGMRILRAVMIGDVVGEPGLQALERGLPKLVKDSAVDFAVVNGENAADGFGMTDATLKRILAAGADAVTSGNHVWEKREFWQTLETDDRILRPANYPGTAAGRGWLCVNKAGASWIVVNLQGRELMTPIDCPFRCFDAIIARIGSSAAVNHDLTSSADDAVPRSDFPIALVDFHAETTREKESLAYYIDGRAALLAGTHTHVQTADERILPKGTAYITDLGMTGVSNSVIGMDPGICLDRARKQVLYRMAPAADKADGESEAQIQGVMAEIDADTGKAVSIRRL